MATWSLLLGAVLNLVAVLLFVVAYRSPTHRARHLERSAFGAALVVALLAGSGPAAFAVLHANDWFDAYFGGAYVATAYVGPSGTPSVIWRAILVQAALVPLPVATWLGLIALRRARP